MGVGGAVSRANKNIKALELPKKCCLSFPLICLLVFVVVVVVLLVVVSNVVWFGFVVVVFRCCGFVFGFGLGVNLRWSHWSRKRVIQLPRRNLFVFKTSLFLIQKPPY